jgi:hypothetical protein
MTSACCPPAKTPPKRSTGLLDAAYEAAFGSGDVEFALVRISPDSIMPKPSPPPPSTVYCITRISLLPKGILHPPRRSPRR